MSKSLVWIQIPNHSLRSTACPDHSEKQPNSTKYSYGNFPRPRLIKNDTIMELQTILNADYLDIIYDHRNKSYGGYELRKHYGQRLARAAAILLLSLTGLACLALLRKPTAPVTTEVARTLVTKFTQITLPQKIEKPKIEKATPPPAQQVETRTLTNPVITDDPIPDDKHMTKQDDLHNAQVGTSNIDGPANATASAATHTTVDGTSTIGDAPPAPKPPVTFGPQMPEFSGDMHAYLSSHLRYPAMARENGIEGQVVIRFVVNEDGSVSDATVVRSIGGGCDEEALRIVRSMPKWKPGKQNGTPVKVFFSLPIRFELH
jgi:protein TonB